MSVCNIRFRPGQVDIISDTMTYQGRSPVALTERKVMIAANQSFIFSHRGTTLFGDIFRDTLPAVSDFDMALRLVQYTAESFPVEWFDGPLALSELVLAGRPAHSEGMEVVRFRISKNSHPRKTGRSLKPERYSPGVHLYPSFGDAVALPSDVSDEVFLRLAMVQHKAQQKFLLPLCVGGVVHQTTITAGGASQRIVGLYPDYNTHASQFGDPNASVVRRFIRRSKCSHPKSA